MHDDDDDDDASREAKSAVNAPAATSSRDDVDRRRAVERGCRERDVLWSIVNI